MGEKEISKYISYPAVKKNVAAITQNQALNGIVFLYKQVLRRELGNFGNMERVKRPKMLPTILTKDEANLVLTVMSGKNALMAKLLYGCGLRLMECLRLRVKDIDFEGNQLTVRNGKGQKDRITMLPIQLKTHLIEHLKKVRVIHQNDLKRGFGEVYLPYVLSRKYPNAAKKWYWQYVFPSKKISQDPRSGKRRRHHASETSLQRAVRKAAKSVGIPKPVSPHTFRHCFATHLIEAGYDIMTVQNLSGHKDVSTTMIYTHVLNKDTVLIDTSSKDILAGSIYAVGIDDTIMVKRIEKHPGKLVLISGNRDYEPLYLKQNEMNNVRIIGKVVWISRDL